MYVNKWIDIKQLYCCNNYYSFWYDVRICIYFGCYFVYDDFKRKNISLKIKFIESFQYII